MYAGSSKKTIWVILNFALFFSGRDLAAQVQAHEERCHKVVLDNAYVRLLDGVVHDTTRAHVHAVNSVVVFLSSSTFEIQDMGERPVATKVNPGDLVYRAYGEKPVYHTVRNLSASPFHFLVVELKKSYRSDSCSRTGQHGIDLPWKEKPVRAFQMEIAKGKPGYLEKSNCACLLIPVTGLICTRSPGDPYASQVQNFVFLPPQRELEIQTPGNETVRCIVLEF
jgi:hypothetical protein